MSCCSKRKKRWPMLVFLLVITIAILLAIITDAKAQSTLQDGLAKTQSQQLGIQSPTCSKVLFTPVKTNNPVNVPGKSIHD